MSANKLVECPACGKRKPQEDYLPTRNKTLFPSNHSFICLDCTVKNITDPTKFAQMEEICRHLGYAFFPDEYLRMVTRDKTNGAKHYLRLYYDTVPREKDWREVEELWNAKLSDGSFAYEVPELREQHLLALKKKWRLQDANYNDYLWLEEYEKSMLADFDIKDRTQLDTLHKICKLSLTIDQAMDGGVAVDKLITSFERLMKSAQFDAASNVTNGAITSISEMTKLFEEKGFKPQFIFDTPKDQVDKTLKDLQEFNMQLFMGEPGLSDLILEKLKRADHDVESFEEQKFRLLGEEPTSETDETGIKVEELIDEGEVVDEKLIAAAKSKVAIKPSVISDEERAKKLDEVFGDWEV